MVSPIVQRGQACEVVLSFDSDRDAQVFAHWFNTWGFYDLDQYDEDNHYSGYDEEEEACDEPDPSKASDT